MVNSHGSTLKEHWVKVPGNKPLTFIRLDLLIDSVLGVLHDYGMVGLLCMNLFETYIIKLCYVNIVYWRLPFRTTVCELASIRWIIQWKINIELKSTRSRQKQNISDSRIRARDNNGICQLDSDIYKVSGLLCNLRKQFMIWTETFVGPDDYAIRTRTLTQLD